MRLCHSLSHSVIHTYSPKNLLLSGPLKVFQELLEMTALGSLIHLVSGSISLTWVKSSEVRIMVEGYLILTQASYHLIFN